MVDDLGVFLSLWVCLSVTYLCIYLLLFMRFSFYRFWLSMVQSPKRSARLCQEGGNYGVMYRCYQYSAVRLGRIP